MIAENRRQMAQFLEERMTRTYSDLSERQELERDTSLVKTYLVEVHAPGDAPDGAVDVLERAIADQSLRERFPGRLHRSDDASLLTLDGVFDQKEALSLYVDSTDPRYWLVHTMGSSNAADWILDRLMKAGTRMDQAWIPAGLLESLSNSGSLRGLGLDFDRRPFEEDEEEVPDHLQFLKMQLWGNRARRVLEVLRQEDAFPDATTLAKIKVKYWPDEGDRELFTLDDIKFDGKTTARGTSFDGHVILLGMLKEAYAQQIQRLEAHGVGFDADEGRLEGRPLTLIMGRPIRDLDRFCATVFSASAPFRLWGSPIRISNDFIRVRAVDLHVGDTIDFEVSRSFIRIYVPIGTCGNTVMRFFTNLQHHFDAQVQLRDGRDEDVLEF